MAGVVDDIKDKLDIVEVVKSYITVLPAGRNFRACCPFHKEKTPSFMISPERRSWHCFGGCNEGGDVIAFVMKYENIEFYDALKMLAERAGIDPRQLSRGGGEYRKYDALYAINEAAKDFFHAQMTPEVRAYAIGRGLTEATIAEFEVGYAPNMPDALLASLVKKGFAVQDSTEAGVVFRTERGTYWDRFRNRLMFPLYNHTGKVVGFTGRVMSPAPGAPAEPASSFEAAKYINSPETPIFNKSKLLYGFHKTKGAVRDAGSAVLVEGQMDFLMAYQSGIRNAVATSGTALTALHLDALRRVAERIVLCFDADEAGQKAIDRGIDLALMHDFSVGVVSLTDKDPADVARENPALLGELIAQAHTAREFYFARYLPRAAAGDGLKRGIRMVLAKVRALGSPVEQSAWLKELGMKTGIGEHTLRTEMDRLPAPSQPVSGLVSPVARPIAPVVRLARKDLIIKRIVGLSGEAELRNLAVAVPVTSELGDMQASYEAGDISPEDRAREVGVLVSELKKELHKERLSLAKAEILAAQALRDDIRLAGALRAFDMLSRQLHTRGDDTKEKQGAESPPSAESGPACGESEAPKQAEASQKGRGGEKEVGQAG